MKHFDARLLFGFLLLVALTGLGIIVALGRVEEHTSFGLGLILGGLTSLSGQWGQWVFQTRKAEDGERKEP